MDTHLELIGIIVISIALLNIAVSIFLVRRNDLEDIQKIFQIIIVWLLPYIGAIGLWLFNRSHDEKREADKGLFGGGSSEGGSMAAGEGGGAGSGD